MKIALVTDTWAPQVNGVVTTLVAIVAGLRERGHEVQVLEPSAHRRLACPGFGSLTLAWRPGGRVAQQLDAFAPDAVHIASEGPMGHAARAHCLRRGWCFSTAFHTRVPEVLSQLLHVPTRWGYAWFRRFHAPSSAVLVPSEGMLEILRAQGFARLQPWSHGVDLSLFKPHPGADLGLPRPLWLYLGRISVEKNIEAFLRLDLPGSKLVCGTGPLTARLQRAHPEVHWRGVVARNELPQIYSAADVFVFPGRSDTFGLTMLEAMACGTPVAAYPVAGPLDVVGASRGGVLNEDLRQAALQALHLPRQAALDRAASFDWRLACEQLEGCLVSVASTAVKP